MLGSRTIKTLTALLLSMTVGAFALMLLETAPVRPSAQQLAAVSLPENQAGQLVRQTAVPIQPIKWRNIVIHGSQAEGQDIAERCHFVVHPDGKLLATGLWERQQSGHHVFVPGRDFNADSIGICLQGEFSTSAPEATQVTALVELARTLQKALTIPTERVYLYSDLDSLSRSPGAAFPAESFDRRLLP